MKHPESFEPAFNRSGMVAERVRKLRKLMEQKKVDGILLRRRRNFSWLTVGGDNHILQTSEWGVVDLLIFTDRLIGLTTKMEEKPFS
ncbi:aminopeptidase P family N-terminal domain-containing protein [Thermicanus aegyptius]|uniref:aminopeptidase P family N-terminal domain-containing protein n=1 Tax=Thermicanus aegyptius TaxID=94009 RepID=UPI0012EBCEDF|nr:aminopeptidase P family N-terminal domain-containing protein [Thermicanus aegyptius]